MRLLVTNTHKIQAYEIIRSLHPFAQHIVAVLSARNSLSSLSSFAAHSRHVNRRYNLPSPESDWRSGALQRDNTEREAAYLEQVLDICEKEGIDTVFPSYDPYVYLFSKNKHLFRERGILVPVPEYEVLLKTLDKSKTLQAAEEAGFPCPRTFVPESEQDLLDIADLIEPPWVIKPRSSANGVGMKIINHRQELIDQMVVVRQSFDSPMVQEYIPGSQKQNFYILADQGGEALTVFCPKTVRHISRWYRNSTAAVLFRDQHPALPQVKALIKHLGCPGGMAMQTKVDERDGLTKLMEINPRLGSHLWHRTILGINEPLLALHIERNTALPAIPNYPVDVLMLEPVADISRFVMDMLDLAIFRFRTRLMNRAPVDPSNVPLALKQLIQSYTDNYLGKTPRKFNPTFSHFFDDIKANTLHNLIILTYTQGARHGIGIGR